MDDTSDFTAMREDTVVMYHNIPPESVTSISTTYVQKQKLQHEPFVVLLGLFASPSTFIHILFYCHADQIEALFNVEMLCKSYPLLITSIDYGSVSNNQSKLKTNCNQLSIDKPTILSI